MKSWSLLASAICLVLSARPAAAQESIGTADPPSQLITLEAGRVVSATRTVGPKETLAVWVVGGGRRPIRGKMLRVTAQVLVLGTKGGRPRTIWIEDILQIVTERTNRPWGLMLGGMVGAMCAVIVVAPAVYLSGVAPNLPRLAAVYGTIFGVIGSFDKERHTIYKKCATP